MNLTATCVARPVATVLLMAGVLLLGALALAKLPIASLPSVERPTIAVSAVLPGGNADTIASSLAQPLERALGVIPGIVEMVSFSAPGGTQITIQFDLEKDINQAANEVQAALSVAQPDLPKDMPSPPAYRKVNPSGLAPIALALTSDVLRSTELYDVADAVVAQKLAEIPGVADVRISGAERGAVRIQVNARLVAGMNLSLESIRNRIRAATLYLPKGSIQREDRAYAIAANDQLFKAEDFRNLVVAHRNGASVELQEVARVEDSVINERLAGWYGDRRAVLIWVFKQSDANVVEIVDAVKAALPQLEAWIPRAVKMHVVYDRTTLIRASISELTLTVQIAIVLVVIVIGVFLRRVALMLIPCITIPVVLAGTFAVMYVAGYGLDNLTLMAIAIAVGFIVDDAVIVVENVFRLRATRLSARRAAIVGARQMNFTIISITVALLGALVPIVLMPDVVGRYFRVFGFTLAAAVILSAIASLTVTPMLCSRLITTHARASPRRRLSWSGIYGWCLDRTLAHPAAVVLVLLIATAALVPLYLMLPKGYMPTQDTGILGVRTITTANISFAAMERLQREVTTLILRDPAVAGLSSYIGTDNGSSMSNGTIVVSLKPLEVRREPIERVVARLRGQLSALPNIRSFFMPWQDLLLGVRNSPSRYQYVLKGADPAQVWRWSEVMRRKLATLPQITDLITSAEASGIETGLIIDRERAAAFGVTPFSVDNTLYDAFGQRQVRTIFLPSNYARVVMEVASDARASPLSLFDIYVPGAGTAQVPLAAVTRLARTHASMWIRHSEQFPAITLSFDTRPGVSIGEAVAAVRQAAVEARIPDDIVAEFRGEAEAASKSRAQQLLLVLAAVITIYLALGILYESTLHPFTILTTLPSALIGALLALWVTGTELTLISMIGCILVIGIVMKNGIIMVDFALAAQRRGAATARDAIRSAALVRARPILMTTFVAGFGAVPIALGTGPGHELRQPLGIVIIGGLMVSQLLTLFTTPVVYLLMERLRSRRAA